MPISYDSERKLFKLDTSDTSYVMEIYDENNLVPCD